MLNDKLFLPPAYIARAEAHYFDDQLSIAEDTVFQPEIYPLAQKLLAGTGRRRLIDVGCGIGQKLASAQAEAKLGIDFGSNIQFCRSHYGDDARWLELDLSLPVSDAIIAEINELDVVICSDVVEHIPDPRPLLTFLSRCFERGALVITSTPERELVRGKDHMGPPPNPAHVQEWTMAEYGALLQTHGLPPFYLGLTLNNNRNQLLRTIVSLHEPLLQQRFTPARKRPLAIMSCYNEIDVLQEVIEHGIRQGCDLHVLDNWSTDGSYELLQKLTKRFGEHLILERFPAECPESGSWKDILARKEAIAACHKGRWVLHTDADELRWSPMPGVSLADALSIVENAGWNQVDFTVLNHRAIDDRPFVPGDLRKALPFFEYGTKPGHFLQKKAWLQGDEKVELVASGGHVGDFAHARPCPYHFLLDHFPLRSAEHAKRKIVQERFGRWSKLELDAGWHKHYADIPTDAPIVWDKDQLFDQGEDFWPRHGLPILSGMMRETTLEA